MKTGEIGQKQTVIVKPSNMAKIKQETYIKTGGVSQDMIDE